MSYSTSLFCFVLAIVVFGIVAPAIADDVDSDGTCTPTADYCWNCPSNTSANATTAYITNLSSLFTSLSSINQTNYGFYNSSVGTGTNKVNLIALCRGDLALSACRACYTSVTVLLSQKCPSKHQAILWAERCFVRYSNASIFGTEENEPAKFLPSPNGAPNPEEFKLVLNPLMKNLTQKAASGDSMKKFAAGHAVVPAGSAMNQTIYATAQCTPDLNKQDCSECLEEAVSDVATCCDGKDGARVLKPSCMLRFERGMFYEPTAESTASPPSSATAPPPTTEGNNTSNVTTKISPSSSWFFMLLLSFLCLFSALALV